MPDDMNGVLVPLLLIVGDREYDLRASLPVTLGDWEDLEIAGVTFGDQISLRRPKATIDLVHILLKKQNPDVPRDAIRALPMSDLVTIAKVLQEATAGGQEDDDSRPTQESS